MSAKELQTWWAWYQLEPWGEVRGDLRMGILASSLVNMWISKGSKTKPVDFMPDWHKATLTPRPRQSAQDMLAVFRRGTQAAGGRIKKAS
jgi:hypothetical protein